jgi:transcription initiation factor TFIIE subunit alpha
MVAIDELLEVEAFNAYLMRLIGEDGIDLLRKFPSEGEHSDEELAETTGINLNTVRHTLYTLYEKRLAQYRRIKNAETGWLTYLWRLRLDILDETIAAELQHLFEKLNSREIFEEENDFYICKECGVIYTFAVAIGYDFECPHCSEKMDHFENELLLKSLKKRVSDIKECLGQE